MVADGTVGDELGESVVLLVEELTVVVESVALDVLVSGSVLSVDIGGDKTVVPVGVKIVAAVDCGSVEEGVIVVAEVS